MVFCVLICVIGKSSFSSQDVVVQGFAVVAALAVVICERFVIFGLHLLICGRGALVQLSKTQPMRVLSDRLRYQRMDKFVEGIFSTFLNHLCAIGHLDRIDNVVLTQVTGLDKHLIIELAT